MKEGNDQDPHRRRRRPARPRPAILGPTATKKDAVNTALSTLVRLHEQRETIDWIIDTDPAADLRDPEIRAAARR